MAQVPVVWQFTPPFRRPVKDLKVVPDLPGAPASGGLSPNPHLAAPANTPGGRSVTTDLVSHLPAA